MANTPETVTLTLTVDVYKGFEEDYREIRDCIINSSNEEGEDALRITLNHFVGTVFDPHNDDSTVSKLASLAPNIWKITFDPSDTFLNIEGLSWRRSEMRAPKMSLTRLKHCGYVLFDVEVPRGIDKRTFLREFNALFKWYSNEYVEWGWADMGYIMDAPSITLE